MKMHIKWMIMMNTVVFLLCGCSVYDSQGEEAISETNAESISTWEEESTYINVDVFTQQDNMRMDNLMLLCSFPEYDDSWISETTTTEPPQKCYGNCRYCFVFKNGEIYCANLYYEYEPRSNKAMVPILSDELWGEFRDVYFLGRLSSEKMQEIEDYIGDFMYTETGDYVKWETTPENMDDIAWYMDIFESGNPEKNVSISKPNYIKRNGALVCAGMLCYDDPYARKIIRCFLDTPFIELWNKHIKTTGQEVWNKYSEM